MRPVTFHWKKTDQPDFGFIAEDMAKIDRRFVTYKNGKVEGVKYPQLTAVLVGAIKELRTENAKLAAKLTALQRASDDQSRELRLLKAKFETRAAFSSASTQAASADFERTKTAQN
jgi:hypothetical protein